jgi:hypothetical protein
MSNDMKEYIIVKRSKQDDSKFTIDDRLYIRESGIIVEKRFKGKLIGHGEEEYDMKRIGLVNGSEYFVLDNVMRIREYVKIIDKDGNEAFSEVGPSVINVNSIKNIESCTGDYEGEKWVFFKYTMKDGSIRYKLDNEKD